MESTNLKICRCGFIGLATIFHGRLCPTCRSQQRKTHYEENKIDIIKARKEYYQNNKEEIKAQKKEYYQENKAMISENHKEYERRRLKTDPVYKLRKMVSTVVRQSFKELSAGKGGKSISAHLPYYIEELKIHLEKQFEPWMTWNNHGKYNAKTWNDNDPSTWTWQIDHITPQANLPYTSMEEDNFKKCWALSNLRPLSSKQNLLDGAFRIRHGNKNETK